MHPARVRRWFVSVGLALLALLSAVPRTARAAEEPTTIVVVGATGDLSARLLVPGLLQIGKEGLLPEGSRIVGMARAHPEFAGDEGFRAWLPARVQKTTGAVDRAAF